MSQAALRAAIDRELAAFPGVGAFFARNLGTGEEISVDGDAVYATASTIKVPILVELYRQVEAGLTTLDTVLTSSQANHTAGSGILRDLSLGIALRAEDVATLMIVVSDNIATNMLIDHLGLDNINATMAAIGCPETRLVNRIDFDAIGKDAKNLAVTTPRSLARVMELIATDAILTPAACAGILGIMKKQHYRDNVPRYLPFTPYAEELDAGDNGLRIYNKTGGWTGLRADVALIEWPGTRYVITAFTDRDTDGRFWAENPGAMVLGRVSRLIFEHFGGGALAPIAPVTYDE